MKTANTSGFTLIELLTVIAIITTLAAIILPSLNTAREQSRDKQRLTDLGQIQLALRLYAEANGSYPCEVASRCPGQSVNANGVIGDGGNDIDALLAPFMAQVPEDPRGSNGTYRYYYDGRHACGGNPNQAVLYAATMETDGDKNHQGLMCSSWGGEGRPGGSAVNSHNVIIGPSPDDL